MRDHTHGLFVLTGGAGSGKSAVVEALHELDMNRAAEAGRGDKEL